MQLRQQKITVEYARLATFLFIIDVSSFFDFKTFASCFIPSNTINCGFTRSSQITNREFIGVSNEVFANSMCSTFFSFASYCH